MPVWQADAAGGIRPEGCSAAGSGSRTVGLPASVWGPALGAAFHSAARRRHLSRRTEAAYRGWVRRFLAAHHWRHPAELGRAEMVAFLSRLATEGKVSASTQNQALAALLFLYRSVLERDLPWLDEIVRAKRPHRVPVVLTRREVQEMLARLEGTPRLVARLLYGSGLRLLEALRLRVKDVDLESRSLTVRSGKGDRGRPAILPDALRGPLAAAMDAVLAHHQADLEQGAGWVEVPDALGRKYPGAGRSVPWQWVFPATGTYRDGETEQVAIVPLLPGRWAAGMEWLKRHKAAWIAVILFIIGLGNLWDVVSRLHDAGEKEGINGSLLWALGFLGAAVVALVIHSIQDYREIKRLKSAPSAIAGAAAPVAQDPRLQAEKVLAALTDEQNMVKAILRDRPKEYGDEAARFIWDQRGLDALRSVGEWAKSGDIGKEAQDQIKAGVGGLYGVTLLSTDQDRTRRLVETLEDLNRRLQTVIADFAEDHGLQLPQVGRDVR